MVRKKGSIVSTVQLRQKRKETLVGQIHKALQQHGVPQYFWPQHIGDLRNGEMEFLELVSITSNPCVPMWHITYLLQHPETQRVHTFTVRYSNGAVAVARIHWTKTPSRPPVFVPTRQYRPCTGGWELEFPQAFTKAPGPGERQFQELAAKKLVWLINHSEQWEKHRVGSFKDDPGTRSTQTQVYTVDLWMTEQQFQNALRAMHDGEKQTRKNALQLTTMTYEEVEHGIDHGGLDSLILIGA